MCSKFHFLRRASSFLLIVLLIVGCDSDSSPVGEDEGGRVRAAKLVEIGEATNAGFLNFPAIIQSQSLSVLSFEVGGMIEELLVVEAQKVAKGEVIARLDQRDHLAKMQSARAQFEVADSEYQRALRLIKEDAISRSELEKRKSQSDVNRSQLETAKKALEDTVLVAPYSGAIAKVSIKIREVIQSGNPAITILGEDGLEATINLPSSIIASAGTRGNAPDSSYIIFDAAPNSRIPATYKEVSLEADIVSQTHEVTFAFDTPANLNVLPGMNAVVWIRDPRKSATESAGISVPLTAISTDGDQKYVWVVDRDTMIVSRRNVDFEEGVGISLVVTSGLESGELIVAAGVSYLSEGMKVRPWSK